MTRGRLLTSASKINIEPNGGILTSVQQNDGRHPMCKRLEARQHFACVLLSFLARSWYQKIETNKFENAVFYTLKTFFFLFLNRACPESQLRSVEYREEFAPMKNKICECVCYRLFSNEALMIDYISPSGNKTRHDH